VLGLWVIVSGATSHLDQLAFHPYRLGQRVAYVMGQRGMAGRCEMCGPPITTLRAHCWLKTTETATSCEKVIIITILACCNWIACFTVR